MIGSKLLAAAGAASIMLAVAPAHAAIVNGDFENGLTGWIPETGSEITTAAGSDYGACCGVTGTPAQLANHFATFGGADRPNVTQLFQQLGTTPGTHYALSFDFGALGSPNFAQTLTASVFDGEQLLATLDATATVTDDLATTFTRHTLFFTAGNGPTNLFFNVDPATQSVDGVLDNVVLTSGAPEPASWALLLSGFAVAGVALRRRRQPGGHLPA